MLNGITEIPEFMQVPDNDLNLFKWSLVCFLANKLATAEITDAKFSVKRPDGGDFVATAQVAVKPTWDISDAEDCKLYSAVGDMWRNNETDSMWWKSWQLNTYWTKRELSWRDNRETDFGNLFYFLNGTLPESESTVESYQRLLDKGYLLKKDGKYKVNIILSDSEQKWWSYIPSAPDEITELSKEYAREATKAELIGQPEHMHEQIRYYKQNAACSLHTRIMKQLVDMGVLKVPTDEQRMGLLTIMFTGK